MAELVAQFMKLPEAGAAALRPVAGPMRSKRRSAGSASLLL